MIVLIDNYDSFTYNLYQLVGSINPNVKVFRNDALTVQELDEMKPDAIILSPGPGRPSEAGICEDVVKKLKGKYPILGVCLGHQAICEACGGKIIYASELMHGKRRKMIRKGESVLLKGLPDVFPAARYHSLAADPETMPAELAVTAVSEAGEVMAVENAEEKLFGLQFHPESIMTDDGAEIMRNFLTC
ncbi:MAG: aminodeoxychorismate/anthranilate synthase component II [Eubacterium sp.]|nr:aminodeoxychorismate/anthranilate synthase component II [Eubacterium sp.]